MADSVGGAAPTGHQLQRDTFRRAMAEGLEPTGAAEFGPRGSPPNCPPLVTRRGESVDVEPKLGGLMGPPIASSP